MLNNNLDEFRVISKEEFLTPLSELNLKEVRLFPLDTTVDDAVKFAVSENMSAFAIGNSEVEALITEDEFLRFIGSDYENIKDSTLGEIPYSSPCVLEVNETILSAILLMGAKKLRHLLIRDVDKLRILLLKDLLNFATDRFEKDLQGYSTKVDWSDKGVYLQERPNFDETNSGFVNLTTHVFETPIRKVMFNEAIFCDVSSTLSDAVKLMKEESTSTIILMEYETEMKGILTARDLLNKGYGQLDFEKTPVAEVMTEAPHKLLEQEVLAVAIKNMNKFKYRNVLICNQVGYPISIVSLLEILSFICSKLEIEELDTSS